ncbi:MAG: M23 family metallopeptidase [bacterium]
MRKILLVYLFLLTILITIISYRYSYSASKQISLKKISRQTKIRKSISCNETLFDSFCKQGLNSQQIAEILDTLKPLFDFNSISIGDNYVLSIDSKNIVQKFVYYKPPLETYLVKRNKNNILIPQKKVIPLKTSIDKIIVKINQGDSLFRALTNIGETDTLVLDFANIFSWDIDFYTDIFPGDSFQILLEKKYGEGKFIEYGKILMAEYKGEKKHFKVIYYKNPQGKSDYYTLEGKSLKKAFLKSPLKFTRISSNYSKKRFHPILKIFRPHLGIDYSAPSGTPIKTIADGIIIYSGWMKGYGNFIKIKHKNNIITTYGHLSKYGKGIRNGKYVDQGQVIGYVGSTGLATGPHSDFRMIKGGKPINPITTNLPNTSPIEKKYLADFNQWKNKLLQTFKKTH